MIKFISILATISFIYSCEKSAHTFSEKVENAHKKETFLKRNAIQFDLQLFFGGTERFKGTITWATNSSKGLLAYSDGRTISVEGNEIEVSDTSMSMESARFTAYTWSYFFMLPYKLNDPGTKWNDYPDKDLNGETYAVEKLTFEAGTGDAPDDWYIVYANTETMLTKVAAYIVTAGQSVEEAEVDPHAIEYKNYKEIEGVPIAHDWVFWAWRESGGLTEELGNANLSNIQFVEGF